MKTITLKAGPVRRQKGPGLKLESWTDCLGSPMKQRIRFNEVIVGTLHTRLDSFWLRSQRKWIAEAFGRWLRLPVEREAGPFTHEPFCVIRWGKCDEVRHRSIS